MNRHHLTLSFSIVFFFTLLSGCDNHSQEIESFKASIKDNFVDFKGGEMHRKVSFDLSWKLEERNREVPDYFKVVVSDFTIQKYPTTCYEFNFFMKVTGDTSEQFEDAKCPDMKKTPANSIPWYDAQAYCEWLGSIFDKKGSLPTEAQWEYAATSGGKDVEYATNNGKIEPGVNTIWGDSKKAPKLPPSINKYPPNPAGIYGLHGGVGEYVFDWHDALYPADAPEKDPMGPTSGTLKVYKGNDFRSSKISEVYTRGSTDPNYGYYRAGFRCTFTD
ncbi:formylglycine-generating enzyme family protein [Zooshikella sp. RANM57]|uniref:formylglycine-generating enzyme family protein n=1 Tax=Zooshikella sp. RANM57 TaxID=3425863 RepID=UPI003D6DCFF0